MSTPVEISRGKLVAREIAHGAKRYLYVIAVLKRLIDANDFEILDDFPKDSIFKENQFVKLENGVYLNIIDKGSSENAAHRINRILKPFFIC